MTIGVLTEAEMAELRALMDAASAGLVMGGDYIGAMLAAAPKLLATIAARDEEIAGLKNKIDDFPCCGKCISVVLDARVAQLEAALRSITQAESPRDMYDAAVAALGSK